MSLSPALLDGRAEHAGQIGGERGQVDGFVGRLDAPCLDARKIEQRVDQLEQTQAVAVRHFQPFVVIAAAIVFGQLSSSGPSISVSGVRNSWLDVREERGLGAVDFGQRLGAFALLFVCAGVGDGGGDLPGDQIEEAAIIVIERQARADSGD